MEKFPKKLNFENAIVRKNASGSLLKTFQNICKEWGLTRKQEAVLLGHVPEQTYYQWIREEKGSLTYDQVQRISLVFGIYKAIKILFSKEQAKTILSTPNDALPFAGKSEMELMLTGNFDALQIVRRYYDGKRGAEWS